MLVTEDALVKLCDNVLRDALSRGKDLKPSGAIDPALQVPDLKAQIAACGEIWREAGIRTYAAVETAARNTFYDILASTSIASAGFGQIWTILDFVAILSDSGYCEPALPLWLVEELLDSQTTDGCRIVFDYLDSRRDRLLKRFFGKRNLIILRACNDLLRRLSRAEDAVFCGRVFVLLFQSFPLGDKSSVNLRGEFHVDNVTTYEKVAQKSNAHNEAMDIDQPTVDKPAEQTPDVAESSQPNAASKTVKFEDQNDKHGDSNTIDMDLLYERFWSLQDWFSQPTKLFKEESLDAFKSNLKVTLEKFTAIQQQQLVNGTAKVPVETKHGTKRKRSSQVDQQQLEHSFNPKYLTSRDLFELEISDLSFRRHILVQALIMIEFLLSQTPKAKKKLDGTLNNSVKYSYELSQENAQWAATTRDEIATYLQQGPEGKFYYRMVDTVLSREKNWVYWKAASAEDMSRDPIQPSDFAAAETTMKKLCTPRKLRPSVLGALDLSFLTADQDADGMDKYRDPTRFTLPQIDSFKGPIMDDDFDIDRSDDPEEKRAAQERRASKLWRTLRIACRGNLNVFDQIDDGANLKPLFEREVKDVKPPTETNGIDADGSDKDGRVTKLQRLASPSSQVGTPEILVGE